MKRWTLRIVLFVVLGCVTTVAVAWGIADRGTERYIDLPFEAEEFGPGTEAPIGSTPTHVRRAMASHLAMDDIKKLVVYTFRSTGFRHNTTLLLWKQPKFDPASPSVDDEYVQFRLANPHMDFQLVASGWPALAMSGSIVDTLGYDPASGEFKPAVRQAYSLIELPRGDFDAPALPLRPIWPGFVINTLFYGVIWFGIFFGFGSARRAVRRRRGRCPKCAYDIRSEFDAGCSECGWNRLEDEA